MASTSFATATDFQEQSCYYPKHRPGYAAWVSLFHFGDGDLGMAFNEIRRGDNQLFGKPTLEFGHAMCLPYRFNPVVLASMNRELIYEYVYLKSSDEGRSWVETGRCPVNTRHYWHTGYPDGRIVRLIGTQQYRYDQGDDRHCSIVDESHDGGNTWMQICRFMIGHFFYIHKVKKLRDGSIVVAGPVVPTFGPGGMNPSRHSKPAGVSSVHETAFMVSHDHGHSWNGPHYVLPGVSAWEPDFVELSDGSLLFINSTVQAGRPVRQIVRRQSTGWVNGPLMTIRRGAPVDDNVQGGFTPESVVLGEDGLIVGARRGGPYTCSNDLGENWFEIEGPPHCHYQPIIESLPDGRFLAAWHHGADNALGEVDMYIGTHVFGVDANLPAATRLTLQRELAADGNQYVNVFRATLTADGAPAAGRQVKFRLVPRWQADGQTNRATLDTTEDVRPAVTNGDGVARVELSDYATIPDMHFSYQIDVVFDPAPGDDLIPCQGPGEIVYVVTPHRTNPFNYPIYLNQRLIMITPQTAKRFADLPQIVAQFDKANPHAGFEKWEQACGSAQRAREVLDFLMEHHIVSLTEQGIYQWYRAGHRSEQIIREVRVDEVIEEYE